MIDHIILSDSTATPMDGEVKDNTIHLYVDGYTVEGPHVCDKDAALARIDEILSGLGYASSTGEYVPDRVALMAEEVRRLRDVDAHQRNTHYCRHTSGTYDDCCNNPETDCDANGCPVAVCCSSPDTRCRDCGTILTEWTDLDRMKQLRAIEQAARKVVENIGQGSACYDDMVILRDLLFPDMKGQP
jgi:hypothetical protein